MSPVDERSRAREAAFEALIERTLGCPAPDLTQRVLAGMEASRAPRASSSWQWLGAVGALFLGLAAVTWTAWHRSLADPTPRPATQDPEDLTCAPHLTKPLDLAEFRSLLEQAERGVARHSAIYTMWFPSGNGRCRWLELFEAGSVQVAVPEFGRFVQLVGECLGEPRVDLLGIPDRKTDVDLLLRDGRRVRAELCQYGQAIHMGVRGAGNWAVTGELAKALEDLMDGVEQEAKEHYAFASDDTSLVATSPKLREVFAYGVDNHGLAVLAERRDLVRAKLVGRKDNENPGEYEGVELGAAAIRHLHGCTSLRRLELVSAEVDEAALRGIAAVRSLRHVSIVDGKRCDLTAEGLNHLVRLPFLESLEIEGCAMDDEGLRRLSKCIALKRVRLVEVTGTTGEGLQALLRLPGLEELSLEKVSAVGMFRDALAPSLRRLECTSSEVSLDGLETLPALERVAIAKCSLELASFEALGRSRMQALVLDDMPVDPGWSVAMSPMLRELTLGRVRASGPAWQATMESWRGLPQLRRVAVRQSRLSDLNIESLSELPHIEVLDVRYNRGLTKPALERLVRRLPSTRVLRSEPE